MKTRLLAAIGALIITTAGAGCASPVYQPPESSYASTHCPTGQVTMCMEYPTRLKNQPPPFCMCQDAARVQQ